MPPSATSTPSRIASRNGCPPLFSLAMARGSLARYMKSVFSSQPVSLAPLERFARVFRDRVDGPMRKAAIGVVALAVFAVAHLARLGTPLARAFSAAFLVLVIAAIGAKFWSDRRGWRNARRVVSRTIVPTNPDLGGRTLRAMNL